MKTYYQRAEFCFLVRIGRNWTAVSSKMVRTSEKVRPFRRISLERSEKSGMPETRSIGCRVQRKVRIGSYDQIPKISSRLSTDLVELVPNESTKLCDCNSKSLRSGKLNQTLLSVGYAKPSNLHRRLSKIRWRSEILSRKWRSGAYLSSFTAYACSFPFYPWFGFTGKSFGSRLRPCVFGS